MKKFISILIPILSIFLLVGGTYFYINYGSKNIKEEHSKYLALINDNHDFTAGLKGLESLTTEKAKETLDEAFKEISYDNIKTKQTEKFNKILDSHVYKDILKVFNCKSLSM